MSNQVVESDYFVKAKDRDLAKIKKVAVEAFQYDRDDFLEDIAEALGIEVKSLPAISVEITVHFGKNAVSVPAFDVEDEEEEEDDDN